MSDTKLGILAPDGAQRDAIHIAVAPVTSDERLYPGQSVALVEGRTDKVRNAAPFIGIVNPFLTAPVQPGELFWMLLYPQTITSLRHEWTHPAFAAASPEALTAASEQWLRAFGKRVGWDYADLLGMASDLEHGSASVGDDANQERFDRERDDFLRHLSVVTGKHFGADVYFSCAC